MKNILFISGLLTMAVLLSVSSCKKKDPPVTTTTPDSGKVKLEFFNNVGGSSLNLNNQWYINENGDSFTVSKFNYYISNVVLTGPGGASYTESDSYHLLQATDNSSLSFDMTGIPAGGYDSIAFMVGVDDFHNTSGAQTGALDPINGMFWDWHTGYIMLKLEGNSPKSPATNGLIAFHCGGFGNRNTAIRNYKIALPNAITVSKNGIPHIHLQADVLALFKSPNKIDFSQMYLLMTTGTNEKMLADNYANMFTISYSGL